MSYRWHQATSWIPQVDSTLGWYISFGIYAKTQWCTLRLPCNAGILHMNELNSSAFAHHGFLPPRPLLGCVIFLDTMQPYASSYMQMSAFWFPILNSPLAITLISYIHTHIIYSPRCSSTSGKIKGSISSALLFYYYYSLDRPTYCAYIRPTVPLDSPTMPNISAYTWGHTGGGVTLA